MLKSRDQQLLLQMLKHWQFHHHHLPNANLSSVVLVERKKNYYQSQYVFSFHAMHIQISSILQVKMPLKGATTIFSTQWQWVCFFLHSGSFEEDCGLCKNSTSKDLFLTSCQHRFCCGCIKEHVHTIIQTQMALTNPTFANLAPCAQCPISRYLPSITAESFTVLKCWYNIENSIPLHFAKLQVLLTLDFWDHVRSDPVLATTPLTSFNFFGLGVLVARRSWVGVRWRSSSGTKCCRIMRDGCYQPIVSYLGLLL